MLQDIKYILKYKAKLKNRHIGWPDYERKWELSTSKFSTDSGVFLIVRKSLLLLVLISFFVPTLLYAQATVSGGEINTQQELTLFPVDPCSLEFRGADVKNVLRSLAIPYKVNLLVSERVSGSVTASFHEVPIREVVMVILKDAGLGYIQDGKILRIDTLDAIKIATTAEKSVIEPITKPIQVNYAFDSSNTKDLTELAAELEKLLSKAPDANLSIIKRTNTILVTDLPENVARIEEMLAKLDKISPQIAIISKIVSVNDSFGHEIGIQWGALSTNDVRNGNTSTIRGGTNTGGWSASNSTSGPSSYNAASMGAQNYMVNLPAPSVGQGVGGAINLLIGKIGTDLLELQLSAMEENSKGKVLSNPKVITQDNQPAKMESNHKVFYLVTNTSASGVTTQSYRSENVKIALEVTPHVIENQIFMDVKVEKGNILPNTTGPPDIKTNTLTTKVLVGSGETIVIGGLIERDTSDIEGGIPLLKDIPFLGWLFKYKTKSDEKKELLIFITPTILAGAQAGGNLSMEGQANVQELLSSN